MDNPHLHELKRTPERDIEQAIDTLVADAETRRLHYMRKRRNRRYIMMTIVAIITMASGMAAGWFLLVKADWIIAALCLLPCIPLAFMRLWSEHPLQEYIIDHQTHFMPAMAKTLGGFQYRRNGGVGYEILARSLIVPDFSDIHSEDCFSGLYRGVQVLFCETRLRNTRKKIVFRGMIVVMELPRPIAQGHVIISAHTSMIAAFEKTRWDHLQQTTVSGDEFHTKRFNAFVEKPDDGDRVLTARLMKELAEAADIFKNAPISAAFFHGKYMCMAIPHNDDMFEVSDNTFPVPTRQYAMTQRREMEKILEIIDVFDLYNTDKK